MDEFRFKQLVNEFCQNGNLEQYRPFLEQFFREIIDTGCKISTRYDLPTSSHSKDTHTCRIMISLRPGTYQKPEHIIWTALHEFGHHFSPLALEDKENFDKIIESEERAWEWASKRFEELDMFKEMLADFTNCKEMYLNTYYDHRNRTLKK